MSSQPFATTGAPTAADSATRGISVLQTAERVAAQIRAEAEAEAARLLDAARGQADQIRADARADAPRLRAETAALLAEHDRALAALRGLGRSVSDAVERHTKTSPEGNGTDEPSHDSGGGQ